MATEFVLSLAAPVMAGASRPLVEVGLDASVTALAWQWDETGPTTATVGVIGAGRTPAVMALRDAIDAPLMAHAEIRHGSDVVWEGVLLDYDLVAGGVVGGLHLVGYTYTLAFAPWLRTDLTSAITSGAALRTALADLAPWLRPGVTGEQWVDPMVSHAGGMADFARMTAAQIADQIRQQGDTQGREVYVRTMPGRTVWLGPRVAPAEPHYVIPFDGRVRRWNVSAEGMAAQVTVERGSASSGTLGATGTNAHFASDRGFAPHVLVPVGDVDVASANALRNAELSRRAVPRVAATLAAERDPATWLSTRHGVPVPYWQPMPGEWVQVAGEDARPIVAVSVDATGQTATYELGYPSKARQASVLARDTIARYRQMLAANGGRLR